MIKKEKENVSNSKVVRAEKILSMIGQSVIAFNKKGLITYINPHATLLLDIVSLEVVGEKIDKVLMPMLNEKRLEDGIIAKSVLQLQKPFSSSNYKETLFISTSSGRKFPVFLTATPVSLGDISEGGVVIFRDITHEEELRLALAQEKNKLAESNKLKDLFIDIMRHDLLNPAGVVKTSTQVALMDEKDAKKKENLQLIESNSDRLIKMIENASVFAKLETGEKIELKEMDLGVILKDAVEGLVSKAEERKIKINLNAEGNFPATVNPLIGDVIANFITNAIKYGPSDSEIDVAIRKENGNYRISVADKGEGIPDKYKTAIFDRFTRLEKGAIKGSGLGLGIVKKIVELHNGKVWVENNSPKGSVFIVELPQKVEATKKEVVETGLRKEISNPNGVDAKTEVNTTTNKIQQPAPKEVKTNVGMNEETDKSKVEEEKVSGSVNNKVKTTSAVKKPVVKKSIKKLINKKSIENG